MRICGIDISGQTANIVILQCEKSNHTLIETAAPKIILSDSDSQDDVVKLAETLYALFTENNIDIVAIKKRNTKGNYSGGVLTFKIEGIIQLFTGARVELVSPTLISSTLKKLPPTILPKFKYQIDAFHTAYTYCTRKAHP